MLELFKMTNNQAITLKIHYFFNEKDSHSMNAKIHNECEKQLLLAIQQLNKYFDESFEVEVSAKKEGGLLDFFIIYIHDPVVLTVLGAFLAGYFSKFFTSQKEINFSIDDRVKKDIENITKIKELIKTGSLTEKEFNYIAANDKSLKKLKSNFYRTAKKEKTIDAIQAEGYRNENIPLFDPKIINYKEFDDCIIPEIEEIQTEEEENKVKIFIVAPVLIKGRHDNWKGILNEQPIEFKMSDKDFLDQVYRHEVKFSNGTYIECILKTIKTTKYPEEKVSISREVIGVEFFDEDGMVKAVGRRKKTNKDIRQITLFDLEKSSLD